MALLASVGSVQLLNCARGQATTISALLDFARHNENLILLLQEPWIDRHGQPPILPNFDTFSPIPLKPKCVTYVRRTPGLTATTIFTAQDSFLGTTITSTLNSKTTTFMLFNFYSPGRAEPIARLLPSIPVPKECILMGDLNAHHVWWQGPLPQTARTSAASHDLAEWLESNNFQLHNVPGLPTHHPRNGSTPSTIDLCLSRGEITATILSLATDHDTTSDHSSITITLALPSAPSSVPVRRNWQEANWETLREHVRSTGIDLTNLQGKEDILRAAANITTILHEAIDAAVPSGTSRKPQAPWWNHSLTLAKRSVKRADKRARLYPTAVNQ